MSDWRNMNTGGSSGVIYGMGVLGALFYFLQHATSLWGFIIGILEALFWPAVILYHVLAILRL